MRLATLAALTVLSLTLAACGGPDDVDGEAVDSYGETADGALNRDGCRGFKSAACRCRLVGGVQMSTSGAVIDPHIEGQPLFTYTVPGKCYNQQADWANFHWNKGCWKDCRDAFGVEGATRDPAVTALLQQAGRDLRALGACGGWHSAPLEFAAGTNRFRNATNMGIGVGTGGRVVEENGQKVCR